MAGLLWYFLNTFADNFADNYHWTLSMNKILGAVLIVLLSSGCADSPTQVVVINEVSARVANIDVFKARAATPVVRKASDPVGYLGLPVRQIADQVEAGLISKGIKTLPIAISSFVDLSQPGHRRGLGAELAEGFFHELQGRGYNLIDHRALAFANRDEQELSLADYYRRHRVSYVLGGSYIANSSGVTLNARMLDTITHQVVATGQSEFAIQQLEGAFPGYDPFSSRDGMIIENAGVPAH
ncbi:MAG: TolB-like protein [Motiliproteus sp.]